MRIAAVMLLASLVLGATACERDVCATLRITNQSAQSGPLLYRWIRPDGTDVGGGEATLAPPEAAPKQCQPTSNHDEPGWTGEAWIGLNADELAACMKEPALTDPGCAPAAGDPQAKAMYTLPAQGDVDVALTIAD